MPSLNRVTLMGHLGKDATANVTPKGTVVAKLTVATSERKKMGDEWKETTDWHNVTCFGKAAERVREWKKGDLVMVEGPLKTDSWEKDGVKQYKTYVLGNHIAKMERSPKADQPPPPQVPGKNSGSTSKAQTPPQARDLPFDPTDDVPY